MIEMHLAERTSKAIEPITSQQEEIVIEATQAYIDKASTLLGRQFGMIPVRFDIRGRAAGMYRVRWNQREIRYNPYIFAKYFTDNLAITVPHEVAHYIVDMVYGIHRVKSHGKEWRSLMDLLGAEAKATCCYELDGIPLKSQQRFPYQCGCQTHMFTTRRHNQAQKAIVQYRCRSCGDTLTPKPEGR